MRSHRQSHRQIWQAPSADQDAGHLGRRQARSSSSAAATDRPLGVVTARAHPRAPSLEGLPAGDDDGDGNPRGNAQVLEQMNQQDHVTTSFWLARGWSPDAALGRSRRHPGGVRLRRFHGQQLRRDRRREHRPAGLVSAAPGMSRRVRSHTGTGEPEPGDAGQHQVERVGLVAAMGARARQRPGDRTPSPCRAARRASGSGPGARDASRARTGCQGPSAPAAVMPASASRPSATRASPVTSSRGRRGSSRLASRRARGCTTTPPGRDRPGELWQVRQHRRQRRPLRQRAGHQRADRETQRHRCAGPPRAGAGWRVVVRRRRQFLDPRCAALNALPLPSPTTSRPANSHPAPFAPANFRRHFILATGVTPSA